MWARTASEETTDVLLHYRRRCLRDGDVGRLCSVPWEKSTLCHLWLCHLSYLLVDNMLSEKCVIAVLRGVYVLYKTTGVCQKGVSGEKGMFEKCFLTLAVHLSVTIISQFCLLMNYELAEWSEFILSAVLTPTVRTWIHPPNLIKSNLNFSLVYVDFIDPPSWHKTMVRSVILVAACCSLVFSQTVGPLACSQPSHRQTTVTTHPGFLRWNTVLIMGREHALVYY